MPDHLLRDRELDVILSIMNLKPLSDERGNNSARSSLGLDRQWLLPRLQVRQVLEGVGDDERSCLRRTLIYLYLCIQQGWLSPFQMERFRSARVGNMLVGGGGGEEEGEKDSSVGDG